MLLVLTFDNVRYDNAIRINMQSVPFNSFHMFNIFNIYMSHKEFLSN
jgi:hypothetical protein